MNVWARAAFCPIVPGDWGGRGIHKHTADLKTVAADTPVNTKTPQGCSHRTLLCGHEAWGSEQPESAKSAPHAADVSLYYFPRVGVEETEVVRHTKCLSYG